VLACVTVPLVCADSDQLERSFRLDLSGRSDALERDRSEATGDWGQAGWV
jgi:hypothetical protein